jgi:hypothetical protein
VYENDTPRLKIAFQLHMIKLHTEYPGYGKGKRIYANKALHKKLDKLSLEFSYKFKQAHKNKIPIDKII